MQEPKRMAGRLRGPGRVALALAASLALAVGGAQPALAEAGGRTELTVEQADGQTPDRDPGETGDQRRATVAGPEASPKTGDPTLPVPAALIAAGAAATIAGTASRRTRGRALPVDSMDGGGAK